MRRNWAAIQSSSLAERSAVRRGAGEKQSRSALARFETPLRLINDVDPALAPHDAVVAMAAAQRFQRVTDFHGVIPCDAVD